MAVRRCSGWRSWPKNYLVLGMNAAQGCTQHGHLSSASQLHDHNMGRRGLPNCLSERWAECSCATLLLMLQEMTHSTYKFLMHACVIEPSIQNRLGDAQTERVRGKKRLVQHVREILQHKYLVQINGKQYYSLTKRILSLSFICINS
ncbi:hypothetical protein E2C01_097546 [Portunus trituberculatus]|uniref:Uncharacterized protein n=1 Tax=Portunus trituberculatus TaxID=210409 RepID=A0A5B7JVG8_PORTR|nr:hypothetical protein [Portunus trituberculatus]